MFRISAVAITLSGQLTDGRWSTIELNNAGLLGFNVSNEDIFLGTVAENITLGRENISLSNIP